MMPSKALVIFIAAFYFPVILTKPTVSRKNDGNGNFGFEYEVSHYPGSSRMHLNTGATSSNHKEQHHPYQSNKNHQVDGYVPHSSGPTDYRPNHLNNVAKPPVGHSPYDPEIIHEPQSIYPPPYDSVAKNIHDENDAYRGIDEPHVSNNDYTLSAHSSPISEERRTGFDLPNSELHYPKHLPQEQVNSYIPQDHIEPPISQEHIHPPISTEHINPPISQEYIHQPVSQEQVNPHIPQEFTNSPISQEHINPKFSQEYINSPISQEHINPYTSQRHINTPVSEEYANPPISQEHINLPIPQEHINPSINQEKINPPISQEHINPYTSQRHINTPVSEEYANPPIPQEHINPSINQEEINPSISQEHINPPIPQEHIIPSINQEQINPSISQEYINTPISQEHINPSINQEQINPSISQEYISNPHVSQEHISPFTHQDYPTDPAYDGLNKHFDAVPTGTKYQFIPSGPPYVTDSHSTHIIHPPLPDTPDKGPIETSPLSSPTLSHDFPRVDEEKVAPISHAFRLPIPALSPTSTGPHADQIPPVVHSVQGDDSLPVAPISHSTRLLIPGSISSESSDVADILPKSQLDLQSPGSFQNTAFAPFPNTAELGSHQINTEAAGNTHGPLELSHHESLNESPYPISHAFRLIVPGIVPNVQHSPNSEIETKIPSTLDASSIAEVGPSFPEAAHTPRISHAFRLNIPSVIPRKHNLSVPQVEYIQDLSDGSALKSSDSGLLALETKSIE